jgi:hypothetical protein
MGGLQTICGGSWNCNWVGSDRRMLWGWSLSTLFFLGLGGGYGLGVWMMGGSALGRAKDSVIALGCGVVIAR